MQAVLAWINAWPDPKKMRSYRKFDLYWHGAVKAGEKFGFRLEEFVVSDQLPLRRMQTVFRARNIRGIIIAPLFEEGLGWIGGRWTGTNSPWSAWDAASHPRRFIL